jgi:galactose mutarotase-like enzyme
MKISNNSLEVEITTFGAEVVALVNKSNQDQVVWSGDKTYWGGRNPILFPIVGSTYDKQLHINGSTYKIGNHGVIRHMEFQVTEHLLSSITLTTSSNEWTLQQFPFQFLMQVKYTLIGNALQIDYRITNHSESVMPFTFGLHPAFNLSNEFDSQAVIKWPKKENLQRIHLDGTFDQVKEINELMIDKAAFASESTIIFQGMSSDYVEFFNGKSTIKVGIAGYPYLAFWRGEQAPFVCIEPWLSMADFKPNPIDFSERNGTLWLNSLQSYCCGYQIVVE